VNCRICDATLTTGVRFHLRKLHQLSLEEYCTLFPEDTVHVLQLYDMWRENVSKANKGRRFSEEHRHNLSLAHMGKMTGMDNPSKRPEGKPIPLETRLRMRRACISNRRGIRGKVSFRTDLGHICRSMWEANIARCLIHCNIPYKYEPQVFVLESRLYIPDFYLPTVDLWLEVKGNWFEGDREKVDLFRVLYPDERLVVIDEPIYRLLIVISKVDVTTLEVDDIVRSLSKGKEVSRNDSLASLLLSLKEMW